MTLGKRKRGQMTKTQAAKVIQTAFRAKKRRKQNQLTRGFVQSNHRWADKNSASTTMPANEASNDWSGGAPNLGYELTNVGRGSSYNERDGDALQPLSLRVRFTLARGAAQTADRKVRVLIALDRAPNQAVHWWTDIVSQVGATTVEGNPKLENRRRFRLLYDKEFYITGSSSNTGTPFIVKDKWFDLSKFKPFVFASSATTGNITDSISNYIVVWFINNGLTTDADNTMPGFVLNSRFKFNP